MENAETAEQAQDTEDNETGEEETEPEEPPVKKNRVTTVKQEKEDRKPTISIDIKPNINAQSSYVMKLFDRSVNLAKFTEETPLYSLCRDWMKNKPRSGNPGEDDVDEPQLQTAEEGDIIEVPRVRFRKGQKSFQQRKEVKINIKEFDKKIDSEVWTKEKLLADHLPKWKEDRSKQLENLRVFQEKHFSANLELLESLVASSTAN